MEIWKTAAHADGKPIHGLWKRTGLSHRTVNRFPTATPDMAVYTHSHNAYYGDYPSDPFLSFMERKRKGQKKNGSAAHGRTVKAALPFWYFCYEKQSIYMWRGAYPEAFKGIWEKENFNKIFMGDNFRSCQQIQNYSNLLCEETRHLYTPTDTLENIVWLTPISTAWPSEVLQHIDTTQKTALLRFRNVDAETGADDLSAAGVPFTFIPQLPIADITTETAWLYSAIAKYLVLDKYSVYDLIAEIPVEGNESRKAVNTVKTNLVSIRNSVMQNDPPSFAATVTDLAKYLGYDTRKDHIDKLYSTVSDSRYHVAFDTEQYQNIAITFHSSKGLEFDQVILFAEDYNLGDNASIYNHYTFSIGRIRHTKFNLFCIL